MKNYLLPYPCKRIGWGLLIADILFFASLFIMFNPPACLPWQWSPPMTDAAMIGGAIAACLIVLSKEKNEDEYIAALRSQTLIAVAGFFFTLSIVWMICGIQNILSWLHIPEQNAFFNQLPLLITSTWVMLPAYIAVFQFRLWRLRKEARDEK